MFISNHAVKKLMCGSRGLSSIFSRVEMVPWHGHFLVPLDYEVYMKFSVSCRVAKSCHETDLCRYICSLSTKLLLRRLLAFTLSLNYFTDPKETPQSLMLGLPTTQLMVQINRPWCVYIFLLDNLLGQNPSTTSKPWSKRFSKFDLLQSESPLPWEWSSNHLPLDRVWDDIPCFTQLQTLLQYLEIFLNSTTPVLMLRTFRT